MCATPGLNLRLWVGAQPDMLFSSIPSPRETPLSIVTFLFTDIEGSTTLFQRYPEAMGRALTRHHEILQTTITAHHGYVFQIVGDGFHASFTAAPDALNAAVAVQRALQAERWGEPGPLRVRMALHTDHAQVQPDLYESGHYVVGEYLSLARTARLLSAGAGGQILLSATTAELVRERLPAGVGLRDLGVHRVKDFTPQQIYQVVADELPSNFPALRTLNSLPNNLPLQLTSFIGRESEIRAVQNQLAQVRLLTLTGPGGVGKTRLSLQVAADCADQFANGVWFVELAALSQPALVAQRVATVLGLQEPTGRTILEVLQEYVRDKELLILLDNCEHLIDACAQLSDALLKIAPRLKILATSREALGIRGEITYPVPSLSFPKTPSALSENTNEMATLAQFEAVQLFVERARMVQPAFAITRANAAALVEICQRLDGIPLALELAAARVKGLTVEQIARRLDDRFRLLTGGSRTAMPHHQTLHATIEWSYSLLEDGERVLLQRLSVFAGGWTIEAAEQVCAGGALETGDVLDLLLRLVDKSLVVVDRLEDAVRYRFLDTIHQFARDRFAESGEDSVRRVRDVHLEYFLNFVTEQDRTLRGAEQAGTLAAMDLELDNLRAALVWSDQSGNAITELRLASGLWRYWRVRSYFSEGRFWFEQALAQSEHAPGDVRARAMLGAGSLASYQADYRRAALLLEASLGLYRELHDKQGVAYCLNLLSHGQMMLGDFDAARTSLDESLATFRELGDRRGTGYALFFMGSLYEALGDAAAARPVLEESLTHLQATGDTWWVGNALVQLGWGINREGDPERALEMFGEALEISDQFADTRGRARALQYIAEAKCSQGKYAEARDQYVNALKLLREIGDKWWGTVALEGLAYVAAQQNDAERVAQLLGAAEHMHELLGAPLLEAYRENYAWSRERARELLGANDFLQAWSQGRSLSFDEAVQIAIRDARTIE